MRCRRRTFLVSSAVSAIAGLFGWCPKPIAANQPKRTTWALRWALRSGDTDPTRKYIKLQRGMADLQVGDRFFMQEPTGELVDNGNIYTVTHEPYINSYGVREVATDTTELTVSQAFRALQLDDSFVEVVLGPKHWQVVHRSQLQNNQFYMEWIADSWRAPDDMPEWNLENALDGASQQLALRMMKHTC